MFPSTTEKLELGAVIEIVLVNAEWTKILWGLSQTSTDQNSLFVALHLVFSAFRQSSSRTM